MSATIPSSIMDADFFAPRYCWWRPGLTANGSELPIQAINIGLTTIFSFAELSGAYGIPEAAREAKQGRINHTIDTTDIN